VRRSGSRVAAAALLAALAALAAAGAGSPERDALAQAPPAPPNVVVVMTDDQDAASLRVMDAVRARIADRGATFERFFATYPLCCPSRATFLTGQYAHNHGLLSNTPPDGGYPGFTGADTALPVALDAAGYRTGLVGKYLNWYPPDAPVPPGWDVWRAAVARGPVTSYDYKLRLGDRLIRYGSEPADFRTDVYADLAVRYIEQSKGSPFFLTVAPSAPHVEGDGLPSPGPGYDGRFDADTLPKPPSFDEADVSDKPSFLRKPPLSPDDETRLTALHRARLASLLPVDRLVDRLIDALRDAGELANTYVIFTSDNGFLLGEHRLTGKGKLYEEGTRVPLVIRGPGVPAGEVHRHLVGNIDLAPTILDAAGTQPVAPVDGRSLLPLAGDPTIDWRREILLENSVSTAIRTASYSYAEHPDGEAELYDLRTDPFQLESLHADPDQRARIQRLSQRLAEIRDCAGADCP
jgi:arylsulfatase A-like enzyme